jgi:flavin reductase (DIM6/NTAB) family NADH-FMN oxidoreductase RutF
MAQQLKQIDPRKLSGNVFRMMGDEWFLFTAGTLNDYNTMTAAWGGLGYLWEKPVAIGFVRPQRHTFGFAERHGHFTFSFFGAKYRKALQFCGSHSGRDCDKAAQTGLTPRATRLGNVYFGQARLVLECRKIYWQDIDPGHFLAKELHKIYPGHDYHRMYVGEIVGCLKAR